MNHLAGQIPDSVSQAAQYVAALPEQGLLWWVKMLFLAISFLAIAAIIRLYVISDWLRERYGADLANFVPLRPDKEGEFGRRWEEIRKKVKGDAAEQKMALIEAEEFLEEFLERRGVKGKTLVEKLANAGAEVLPKERAKELHEAYRLVSQIIFNQDYEISRQEAARLMGVYHRALQDFSELGV